MSNIRIIQIDIGDLDSARVNELVSKYKELLPEDVIITIHKGDTGRLSAINSDEVYDIHYTDLDGNNDCVGITGEELYTAIKTIVESKGGDE